MATKQIDVIAAAVHEADTYHASILETGSTLEILTACRACLVATLALAVDSGDDESQALYAIEDVDAEIARL